MLYLLAPHQPLQWCDMPTSTVEYLTADADTSKFDWKPAERHVDDTLVALVLRNGHLCRQGVVVTGTALVNADRAQNLIETYRTAQQAQDRLRQTDTYAMLDQMMPGHADYARDLDRGVAESHERSVKEARRDLADDLAKPVKAEVVAFWEQHGGTVPNM